MPPQLTNISPGIEGDAARRGLTLSIVSKSAIDQALAARLKASAAALDDAMLEKDPIGPPAVSTRRALALLTQYCRAFWGLRASSPSLQDLSNSALMDIGLTRGEIDYLTPQRAIDTLRDNTRYLWARGGM